MKFKKSTLVNQLSNWVTFSDINEVKKIGFVLKFMNLLHDILLNHISIAKKNYPIRSFLRFILFPFFQVCYCFLKNSNQIE